MRRILIVEDEKMIRKGLRVMVERSGFVFDEILECQNGEEALRILTNTKIDLLFTDIRMPKMDGIALVNQMQTMVDKPITIVISGFDDFNYAVDMLRNGVREYILKPIERKQIFAVLEKVDLELRIKEQESLALQHNMQTQLQCLIFESESHADVSPTTQSIHLLPLFMSSYYLVVSHAPLRNLSQKYELTDLYGHCVSVLQEHELQSLDHLAQIDAVGVSLPAVGIEMFQQAYIQALQARKEAFSKRLLIQIYEQQSPTIVPLQESYEQCIVLLGMSKHMEALAIVKRVLTRVEQGDYQPDTMYEFFEQMHNFFANNYQHLPDIKPWIHEDFNVYSYATAQQLYFACELWMCEVSQCLHLAYDDYENKQKIEQALSYVQEHYASGINMAVVSNQVSMNYTLFSTVFKLYTGKSFVKVLQETRLEASKKLLTDTELKVFEISEQVGFVDEKHFMKLFKAHTGISPSEYRKVQVLKGS
ncbi:MAG: response regulator transcription factor [Erysipelotrichaceae bacterium]